MIALRPAKTITWLPINLCNPRQTLVCFLCVSGGRWCEGKHHVAACFVRRVLLPCFFYRGAFCFRVAEAGQKHTHSSGLCFCCVFVYEVIWLSCWAERQLLWMERRGQMYVAVQNGRGKGPKMRKRKRGNELVNTTRSGTGHKPFPAPKTYVCMFKSCWSRRTVLTLSVSELDLLNIWNFPIARGWCKPCTDRKGKFWVLCVFFICFFSDSTMTFRFCSVFSFYGLIVILY